MKKKYIYVIIILYIISISCGIFVEIITPSSEFSAFSDDLESFFSTTYLTKENYASFLFSYVKKDFILVLSMLLLSFGVVTAPVFFLLTLTKSFSLGFTAAFVISMDSEGALLTSILAVLPRGLMKLPIYFYLTILSVEIVSILVKNSNNLKKSFKLFLPVMIKVFFSFTLLVISSMLEAFLLSSSL